MPSFGNSQNLVEIADIRQNTLVLEDGGFRQIVMVGGVNFSLRSEEEQNATTMTYQNFLNSLDFPFQVVVHSRKINVQKYLTDLSSRALEEPSALLQNQITEYREFIRQFVEENAIMEKSFLAVVPWYPATMATAGRAAGFLPFFGRKKNKEAAEEAKRETDKAFAESYTQISQRTEQVLQGLAMMGLEASVLTTEELEELCYNFYNPGSVERENIILPANND